MRELSAQLTEGENHYPSVTACAVPAPLARGARGYTCGIKISVVNAPSSLLRLK